MKIKDLRKKTIGELEKDLKDRVESLNNFRLGISNSKIKNTKEGRNLKREIARMKTLLREEKKS